MTGGACLCGAVRFSGGLAPGPGVHVCHCGMCRRWGGGPFMAVHLAGGVRVDAGEALVWHASSAHGERGFCNRCGTSLFWRVPGEPADWAVNVHALDEDHGQTIAEHIWVDDRPGFYDFADTTPRLTAADFMARLRSKGES